MRRRPRWRRRPAHASFTLSHPELRLGETWTQITPTPLEVTADVTSWRSIARCRPLSPAGGGALDPISPISPDSKRFYAILRDYAYTYPSSDWRLLARR